MEAIGIFSQPLGVGGGVLVTRLLASCPWNLCESFWFVSLFLFARRELLSPPGLGSFQPVAVLSMHELTDNYD